MDQGQEDVPGMMKWIDGWMDRRVDGEVQADMGGWRVKG